MTATEVGGISLSYFMLTSGVVSTISLGFATGKNVLCFFSSLTGTDGTGLAGGALVLGITAEMAGVLATA